MADSSAIWLRMGEACRKVRFSRPTLRKMCEEGKVLANKHGSGGHWRILESSLDAYMDPQDVHQTALEHLRRLGL